MVQGTWGAEGVSALVVGVVIFVAREWRRVQLARERRRERELGLAVVEPVEAGIREAVPASAPVA